MSLVRSWARFVRGLLRGRRPIILLYHRIAEETFDPWGLAVAPQQFEAQMQWLAQNRSILPLAELARRHGEGSLEPDAVAITFDDGYACNARTAIPILERLGIPATIFLPAELIDRGTEFWWDELQEIVLGLDRSSLQLEGAEFPIGERSPLDRRWCAGDNANTERQRAFMQIWSRLQKQSTSEIEAAMSDLRWQAGTGPARRSSHRPMSPGETRNAASKVIALGSHALTHPSLPALASAEKAREIHDSVERCEALTGTRPTTLAYPFGHWDTECEQLARQAGFACACITGQRPLERNSPMFALPRMQVGNWAPEQLEQMLAGR